MNKYVELAKTKFEQNKSLILFCVVSTFIIGLITHGYMYLQDSFSHDSLSEIEYLHRWKIQLGRYVAPIYTLVVRGHLALPWLIGVYSLLWTSCSVFLVSKIFDTQNKIFIFLTAAIFTANISIIATTATYIHDLDSYTFAVFLSVLAVYFWKRFKFGYLLSPICVSLTLGIYQSFISVTISLIIIFLIIELLNGEKFKAIFTIGLKSLLSLTLGGIIYIIGFKAMLFITNIQQATNGYNTLDNMTSMNLNELFHSAITAYYTSIKALTTPTYTTLLSPYLSKAFLTILFISIIYRIVRKNIRITEKLAIIALLIILPFAMNISCFLSGGMSHDLMHFAVWLTYLLALLIVHKENVTSENNRCAITTKQINTSLKIICSVMVFFIVANNIVLANEVYLKKDLEQDANLSFFTRVVDDMESIDEYDNKTTPVAFIGHPHNFESDIGTFVNSSYLTGASNRYVIGALSNRRYENYFNYKLNYYIITIEDAKCQQLHSNETIKAMPNYPDKGSIAIVDGILVVKFNNIDE